jgi:hypothetical protein
MSKVATSVFRVHRTYVERLYLVPEGEPHVGPTDGRLYTLDPDTISIQTVETLRGWKMNARREWLHCCSVPDSDEPVVFKI